MRFTSLLNLRCPYFTFGTPPHIQGFIYSVISSNKNYSQFLHEQGYRTSGSSFKLFTFGPLNGTYHVNRQRKRNSFFWCGYF